MRNFTISLGIGLNMLIQEYITVIEPSFEIPKSWSVKYLAGIGLSRAKK